MKIKDLLIDESKWTKGAYARDRNNLECNANYTRKINYEPRT